MQHKNLWAPWRMAYIQELVDSESHGGGVDQSEQPEEPEGHGGSGQPVSCFLCEAAGVTAGSDRARERLVLINDHRGVVLLNRYPYTNGHLLVAPQTHLGDLTDLGPEQRGGFIELIAVAERLLADALNPQGMNIGMNIGRCAGAGLPGHLHAHVVPRWSGDTNYMQVVGQVRVIPQALERSYECLERTLAESV